MLDGLRACVCRLSLGRPSTCALAGLVAVGFAQLGLVSPAWAALSASLIVAAIAVSQRPRGPFSTIVFSSIVSAVSFLPLAVCLVYSLPGFVYLACSLPLLIQIASEARRARGYVRCGAALGTLLIALGAAWIGNRYLVDRSGWETFPATLATATMFYLIHSVGLATMAARTNRGMPKQWSELFFRGLPAWLLIPAALGAVSLLTAGPSVLERAFGSVLFLAGVLYLSRYRFAPESEGAEAASGQDDPAVQTVVDTLTAVTGAKNHDSPGTTRQLKSLARAFAEKCACSREEMHTLQLGAALHDIGKVGVPDHILMKPGALTSEEFSQVASHVSLGAAILRAAKLPEAVREVVLRHREHWDGSGYPDGLKGLEIPRLARILTIVDSFHALVSDRPFRPALDPAGAVNLMSRQRGKIFDPELLDRLAGELPALWKTVLDAERPEPLRQDFAASSAHRSVDQHWMDEERNAASRNRHSLQKLTSAPDQLVAFYDILRILGADLNFDKSLKQCVSILCRAMPCDKAGIFILDGESFVLMQGAGFPGSLRLPLGGVVKVRSAGGMRGEKADHGRIRTRFRQSGMVTFPDTLMTSARVSWPPSLRTNASLARSCLVPPRIAGSTGTSVN